MLIGATLFVSAFTAIAEPFINTSDLHLKASLQQLSAAGHLNIPLTTYPLMWNDVNRALSIIAQSDLSDNAKKAYFHVKGEFKKATKKNITLSANTASKDMRFTSFGDSFRQKNNLTLEISNVYSTFAFKLSPSMTTSPIEGNHYQFNDSYIAAKWGNWNVSLGTQDRWWGPGWDTNMGLTNNARPMPTLSFTRNTSEPVTIPFTDYQIPWNVTTFIGQMEEDRHIPNTLLWGFRLNFIPLENLEVSLIRLAQWSGDGRNADLSTFWDILQGKDNCGATGSNNVDCGENDEDEPGNQSAGIDSRYSFSLFSQPIGIYGQYLGEDGSAKSGQFISKPMIQFGADTHFLAFEYSVSTFVEYSDTFRQCGNVDGIGNCIYEHHIYKTGMRYKKRSLGNLYDNDAHSYVFGFIGQNHQGIEWDVKLRYVELNQDNSDRYPSDEKGNTLTEIAEDMTMVSTNFKQTFGKFSYKVGLSYSNSSYINLPDNSESNVYLELRRRL